MEAISAPACPKHKRLTGAAVVLAIVSDWGRGKKREEEGRRRKWKKQEWMKV